jgi:rRNA maturation RNase YbeY
MSFKEGKIFFHYLVPPFYFPHRGKKKQFIKKVFTEHRKRVDTVNFVFCSDSYLLALNKKYLRHHYHTDIVTFDLSDDDKVVADVFISVDRALVNAKSYRVPFSAELLRLLIHGALHLCGFNDKTPRQFNQMKKLEEEFLRRFTWNEKI